MSTSLVPLFLKWFYFDAPRRIIYLVWDFLAWTWTMFSIGYFLPRIFSPWHRDITGYGRGFDIKVWAEAIIYNGISRVAGAILRIFFIITGLLLELVIILAGALVFVCWLLLPFIVIYLLATGVTSP